MSWTFSRLEPFTQIFGQVLIHLEVSGQCIGQGTANRSSVDTGGTLMREQGGQNSRCAVPGVAPAAQGTGKPTFRAGAPA